MTLPTYGSAVDEILGLFKVKWNTDTAALNSGTPYPVEWPEVDQSAFPSVASPFARVRLRHLDAKQVTFGEVGNRRFESMGLVTIQVFVPLSHKLGLSLVQNLAIIARNAYRGVGTASGIWFRNAKIIEVGPDRGWMQRNMVCEFQYDELS